jgi:radical SAM superfamily enzyme YgiQ (UPF0313 family)
VIRELDEIVAVGAVGAVYFVHDNFVGNRKAAKELLPHLVEWQKKNRYPVEFACEATLNTVRSPDLLEMMREASFWTVFFGIETPEKDALAAGGAGLYSLGIPKDSVIKYDVSLKSDQYLLLFHGAHDAAVQVEELLANSGSLAVNLHEAAVLVA